MVTPADWKEARLGDLGSTYGGLSGKSAQDFRSGDASYVTFMNVMSNVVLRPSGTGQVHVRSGEAQSRLQVGDVIFNGSSETPEEVGFGAAVPAELEGAYLNSFCFGLRCYRDSDLDAKFLAYLTRSPAGRAVIRPMAQGSTRYNLAKTNLLNGRFLLPPLKEQQAIAEALGDADAAIELLDALIAKKRDVKQAAMQQLLTGRTRLPGFSEVWLDTTLGGVAQAISGGTPSTAIAVYWDGGIPWCTPTDITATRGRYLKSTERTITQLGISSSGASLLPAGALLLCTRATIGEVRIAAQPTATNQGFKSLVVRPGTSNIFLYYLISTLRPKFIERASGSTFLEIGRGDLISVDIRIPQEDEQAAIAEVLSDMDSEIEALVAERDKMRLVKQGMMQELLSGRVRLV